MRYYKNTILHRLVRWAWTKLTLEDPVVSSNNLSQLSGLNTVHCEFLDKLGKTYPELLPLLKEHQRNRFKMIDRCREILEEEQNEY